MTDANRFFEIAGSKVGERRAVRGHDEAAIAAPTPAGREGLVVNGRRSWAEADGIFWGTPQSHDRLPSGLYRMDVYPNMGPVFVDLRNDTDDLVALPDSESQKILDEIRLFKGLRAAFKKHGFLYKRGILMWGPPGSGKTCTLQQLVKMLREEHDGIAVLVDRPSTAATCLQALRRIEPERQVVAIMEDLDALTERYGESEYLALLDGESQVDNIVYIATTNYPEKLDRRFVDRPSRFDTIRYIGMPSAEARGTYLKAKVPDLPEVPDYVAASDGFSIAHLRELIVLTQCFGMSLANAAKRLRASIQNKPSSARLPDAPQFGFG